MEELKPRNGTWIEEIAYLLNDIKLKISGTTNLDDIATLVTLLNDVNASISTMSNTTGSTEIQITEVLTTQPQHIYVYQNTLWPTYVPRPNINVSYNRRIIQSPPIYINIPLRDIYAQVCGGYRPTNDDWNKCKNCVDSYYNQFPDTSKGGFTGSRTGCNKANNYQVNQPQEPKPDNINSGSYLIQVEDNPVFVYKPR